MQILKLNQGVTQGQFQDTVQGVLEAIPTAGEAALFGLFEVATMAGGPAGIGPGGTSSATLDLQPGEYSLVCFIAGSDGVPHIAKGMVAPLTVGSLASDQPSEPSADVEVSLADFAFNGAPSNLDAGETTFKVVNEGQEPHEMAILRLDGITVDAAKEILMTPPGEAPAGPPPFNDAGGFQANMPGDSGWATVDLEKGEYVLVCFVPSPANEFAPHLALGMFSSITVQ